MTDKMKQNARSVSANALVMPIVVVLAVLHIIIIMLILAINNTSSNLSTIMQNQGRYTQEATSLLAGSSLLSETATNFVLMPTTETGESNFQPLMAYAEEIATPEHRGDAVLARFQGYDIPEEAYAQLETAAACANDILDCQLHALALSRSAHPTPPIPQLEAIPDYALSDEEQAMDAEQKMSAARALLLSSKYSENKGSVSRNVNGCVGTMQMASNLLAGQTARQVATYRRLLWVTTLTIIGILVLTFFMLYKKLLNPLDVFVNAISDGKKLDEKKGFREVRLVASAYNDVLKRRNALDEILRSAAETDALTNLPNRYRFQQYMLELEGGGYSLAVLLFDVNYLKKTNDTEGHLAGDRLIRTAAECISSCFGENCFRFGGDEFAAIVKDCTPNTIEEMINRFREIEDKENVSISLGYAYADDISTTTLREMLEEADKSMYREKQRFHNE